MKRKYTAKIEMELEELQNPEELKSIIANRLIPMNVTKIENVKEFIKQIKTIL